MTSATRETKVFERVESLRLEAEARQIVAAELAARSWREPVAGVDVGRLAEMIDAPREQDADLIEGLMGAGHNVGFAAGFKLGKTTTTASAVAALVDGAPFLGRPTDLPEGRNVAWVNGEMDRHDWHDLFRPMNADRLDRLEVWHSRGSAIALLDDHVADRVVSWLRDNGASLWVVDSWRRLCAWSGVNENVNEEVERLTARIDQIKAEAGVGAFLTIAHTGRAEVVEGAERARGATAFDDWVDVRWLLSAKDGRRFFAVPAARGGCEMGETALTYDPAHNLVSLGEGNRRTSVDAELLARIVSAVEDDPGRATSALARDLGHTSKKGGDGFERALRAAQADGLVHHTDNGNGRRWFPQRAPASAVCVCSGFWAL